MLSTYVNSQVITAKHMLLLTCCRFIHLNALKSNNIKIILLLTKQKSQSEYSIFFNQPLVWEPSSGDVGVPRSKRATMMLPKPHTLQGCRNENLPGKPKAYFLTFKQFQNENLAVKLIKVGPS